MTALVITIPGRPPTPNARDNQTWRWIKEKKWRADAATIALAAKPHGWQPLQRCILLLEFVVPTRARRDWDNLFASTKPLTDGMVDAGIIAGDDTEVIAVVSFRKTHVRGVTATVYHFDELPVDQMSAFDG